MGFLLINLLFVLFMCSERILLSLITSASASILLVFFTNDLGTTTNFPELPRFQLGIGFDIPVGN